MGYYTKLKLSLQLNKEAPLDILEKLCNQTMYKMIVGIDQPEIGLIENVPNLPIGHEFGKTHRWNQIFNSDVEFNKERRTLKIICEIKAYENDYEKLINWLKPFIVSGKAKCKGEDTNYWQKLL